MFSEMKPVARMATSPNDPVTGTQNDSGDIALSVLVRELHRGFARALQRRIASQGVSMGQWFFLRVLWERDGLTQRELSQRVGMMEPTTVTAVTSMERRGFVRRVRNPHDRRKVNIYLTDKGKGLRDLLLPCAAELEETAIKDIGAADVACCIAVLNKVMKNIGVPSGIGEIAAYTESQDDGEDVV